MLGDWEHTYIAGSMHVTHSATQTNRDDNLKPSGLFQTEMGPTQTRRNCPLRGTPLGLVQGTPLYRDLDPKIYFAYPKLSLSYS